MRTGRLITAGPTTSVSTRFTGSGRISSPDRMDLVFDGQQQMLLTPFAVMRVEGGHMIDALSLEAQCQDIIAHER